MPYNHSTSGFFQNANIIHARPGASGSESSGPGGTGVSGLSAVRRYYHANFKLNQRNSSGGRSERSQASPGGLPKSWFGTVTVGKEPIVESAIFKEHLAENYRSICDRVIFTTRLPAVAKNLNLQNALLLVLPKLAAFNREMFAARYLTETVAFMDRLLGEKNRYNAFVAIGLLALAIKGEIHNHLKNVLTQIKLSLPAKEQHGKKRNASLDPAVFACISMLARAVKTAIKPELTCMLEPMLSVGLSPSLTVALHELAVSVPSFKKDIAEGLLKILSQILMQQPFRHPGTPKRLISPSHLLGGASNGVSSLPEIPDTASVVLGLRTLGSFDFEGHSLLQFVRHSADNYLHSEEKPIRLEAVKTCSQLLKNALTVRRGQRTSPTVQSTVNDVLSKLLIVGITDQDADVRSCVMDCLDPCFDFHLAQAENLSALFVAMNDEIFEIREQTICIIGRLCILNPAYIMPSLRKTLIQLLTEMEFSGVGRNKEQSARMLGHLVANAPGLIKPYVEPILKVLIPKLKETDLNPMVVTSVLR